MDEYEDDEWLHRGHVSTQRAAGNTEPIIIFFVLMDHMYMRLWSASASFVFAGMTNRSASASFASLYCPWHVRFHCMTNVPFHIIIVFLLSFFKVLGAKLTKRTIIAVHDSYCTCHLVNKNVMLKHLVGIQVVMCF